MNINFGHHFALPFESSSSVRQRIFISNPAVSHLMIDKILYKQGCDGGNPYGRVHAAYQKSLKQCDRRYDNEPYIEFTQSKTCFECQKSYYYPNALSLPYLNICPIHQTSLINRCTSANRIRPCSTEESCIDCCHQVRFIEYAEARLKLSKQNFQHLSDLTRILAYCDYDCIRYLSYIDYEQSFTNNNMELANSFFPTTRIALKIFRAEEIFEKFKIPVFDYQVRNTEISKLGGRDYFTNKNGPRGYHPYHFITGMTDRYTLMGFYRFDLVESMIALRRRIFNRIYELLLKLHPKNHSLDINDSFTRDPTKTGNDCPYCVALTTFFLALMFSLQHHDIKHHAMYFTFSPCYKDSGINIPTLPIPLTYFGTYKGSTYTPCNEFTYELYEMELLCFFHQIYDDICGFYEKQYKPQLDTKEINNSALPYQRYGQNTFHYLANGKLSSVYPTDYLKKAQLKLKQFKFHNDIPSKPNNYYNSTDNIYKAFKLLKYVVVGKNHGLTGLDAVYRLFRTMR